MTRKYALTNQPRHRECGDGFGDGGEIEGSVDRRFGRVFLGAKRSGSACAEDELIAYATCGSDDCARSGAEITDDDLRGAREIHESGGRMHEHRDGPEADRRVNERENAIAK